MEKDPEYKVILRGQGFTLTKSQIEFNSPNYFTACFLGDFRESETRQLSISRDPDLFKIIMDYLCGYQVLPLNEHVIPPRMSLELALLNLRADASFYLLEGLVKECDGFIKPKPKLYSPGTRYLILGCTYSHSVTASISGVVDSLLGQMVEPWHTYINQSQIDQGPLATLERPESFVDYAGLRRISEVERFVRAHVIDYDLGKKRLVGWQVEIPSGGGDDNSHTGKFMVVLK